jgi:hypothetical protein
MRQFVQQSLEHYKSITLRHHGDCSLLGISPNLTIYVEEIYGEDDQLTRYKLDIDGRLTVLIDDDEGINDDALPINLARPAPIRHTTSLNFSIGRYQGMREQERIADLLQPLTIQEKMALVNHLKLAIMPPLLLGIAESTILAEALLTPPDQYLVCRRIRLAYALPQPRIDNYHQSYDYDTAVLYVAHLYDSHSDEEPLLHETITASQLLLPDVKLHRPMDCLIFDNHLLIADGGDETRTSHIHIWTISEIIDK